MSKNWITATNEQTNNAIASFNPFGWLDIQSATTAALNAGKDTDFVFECVDEFMQNSGITSMDELDPVYCVYDALLQEARTEIEKLTKYDFCNDSESGEIYTAGNFMCTLYDWKEKSKEELIEKLKKHKVVIEDTSDVLQFFLDQLKITQSDLTKTKKLKK